MSSCDTPKLFWEIRPYCEEDVKLSKKLLSGELKWADMILLDKYKAEEPIAYLVLTGTLLQIGFGWARPVPIAEESADQKLDHFALLLASSFFTNFPCQNILSPSQGTYPGGSNSLHLVPLADNFTSNQASNHLKEAKHSPSSTELVSPLSKIQKNLSSYFTSSLKVSDSNINTKPQKRTISSKDDFKIEPEIPIQKVKLNACLTIFPESIIQESQSGGPLPDLTLLDKSVRKFWGTKGQPFFSSVGADICSLASESFISMKTPSQTSFIFDYNLNKDPKTLAIEALGRLNQVLDASSHQRTRRTLIDGYVLVTCFLAVEKPFSSTLAKSYVMPGKRLQKVLHDYNKLVTVWSKRAPLSRMYPKLLRKVFQLKVNEVKILATAISMLFSAKIENI